MKGKMKTVFLEGKQCCSGCKTVLRKIHENRESKIIELKI